MVRDLVAGDVELIETHVSWVFRTGTDVFKLKKPIDLGFLDFRTATARRAACEAEVHLNQRLAPDVYLGFLPVTVDRKGRHRFGGPGRPVDWAVHMRQLPDAERADRRLAEGRLAATDLAMVAKTVAAFHGAARADEETASFGTLAAIESNVRENFTQTRDLLDRYLTAEQAAEIEAWQLAFLEREADRFERRRAEGRVRDGHGDLRLEHIYLDDRRRVRILDCIEFNDRFRYADVAADVAFLAMDLTWHDRVDLAERFLAAYVRETDDFGLYPLIDFYESYRAFVRGKVSAFLAADETASAALRAKVAADARRFFLLSLASERRRLDPPLLVAVGGLIATGKSTAAEAFGAQLGAPVVSSDRVRKRLLDVEETEPLHVEAWRGPYDAETTARVYEGVLERARAVLLSGRAVVVDASFRSAAARAAARALAVELGVPFRFVECVAPEAVCRARLAERARAASVSDGREAILDTFRDAWETVDELPADEHTVLDTTSGEPIRLPWTR